MNWLKLLDDHQKISADEDITFPIQNLLIHLFKKHKHFNHFKRNARSAYGSLALEIPNSLKWYKLCNRELRLMRESIISCLLRIRGGERVPELEKRQTQLISSTILKLDHKTIKTNFEIKSLPKVKENNSPPE